MTQVLEEQRRYSYFRKMKNDRLTFVLSRSTATRLNEWLSLAQIIFGI